MIDPAFLAAAGVLLIDSTTEEDDKQKQNNTTPAANQPSGLIVITSDQAAKTQATAQTNLKIYNTKVENKINKSILKNNTVMKKRRDFNDTTLDKIVREQMGSTGVATTNNHSMTEISRINTSGLNGIENERQIDSRERNRLLRLKNQEQVKAQAAEMRRQRENLARMTQATPAMTQSGRIDGRTREGKALRAQMAAQTSNTPQNISAPSILPSNLTPVASQTPIGENSPKKLKPTPVENQPKISPVIPGNNGLTEHELIPILIQRSRIYPVNDSLGNGKTGNFTGETVKAVAPKIGASATNDNSCTVKTDGAYEITVKGENVERILYLKPSDSIEILYKAVFLPGSLGKLIYEDTTLLSCLTAEDAGFFEGSNYVFIEGGSVIPQSTPVEKTTTGGKMTLKMNKADGTQEEIEVDPAQKVGEIIGTEKMMVKCGLVIEKEKKIVEIFEEGDAFDLVECNRIKVQ